MDINARDVVINGFPEKENCPLFAQNASQLIGTGQGRKNETKY